MIFECNTKPLSDALNLGIISSNVSNFHKKSCIVQVSATKSDLVVNIESARICTQLNLKGAGDSDDYATIFVDSLLIKQLMSTIDTPTVKLEFADGGLIIHSGDSKFTLPKMIDETDLDLARPSDIDSNDEGVELDKTDWKFIKDNQMFAIAMSFIHPVYTRVWIGSDGDVLVGDFDNSLFTHSEKGSLGNTCLLSDTIINLFDSVPEGSKLIQSGRNYIISYNSDSFKYVTEFQPQYEDDEDVGSYNSQIFLDMMSHGDPTGDPGIVVSSAEINKYLSQASLLSSGTDDTIQFLYNGDNIELKDKNVKCYVKCGEKKWDIPEFAVTFNTENLRKVLSNYGDSDVTIYPVIQDEEAAGILVYNDDLTTLIAGVEE